MKEIKAKLSDIAFQKLKKKKNDDGFAEFSWDKWLSHLVEDIKIHDTDRDNISKHTVKHLDPLWMRNLARNLHYILKDGKSAKLLVDAEKDKTAIIVGAGPSIYKHKHLEMLSRTIKNRKYNGIVCATDKMLIPLLKKNIVPQYVVSIDAHAELVPNFYRHKLVKENADKIKVVIGTFVSPNLTKLLRKIRLDTYWFSATGEKRMILLTVSEQNPNGLIALRSCGNTGSTAFTLSWAILKCNPTALIGMDMGYPEGVNLEETPYYSGVLVGDKTVSALVASPKYEVIYHPIFKTRARIDPVFSGYRREFLNAIRYDLPKEIKLYNCTGGGTLFCEGMECITFREFLENRS